MPGSVAFVMPSPYRTSCLCHFVASPTCHLLPPSPPFFIRFPLVHLWFARSNSVIASMGDSGSDSDSFCPPIMEIHFWPAKTLDFFKVSVFASFNWNIWHSETRFFAPLSFGFSSLRLTASNCISQIHVRSSLRDQHEKEELSGWKFKGKGSFSKPSQAEHAFSLA